MKKFLTKTLVAMLAAVMMIAMVPAAVWAEPANGYYDENGNWIDTGAPVDGGEVVDPAQTPVQNVVRITSTGTEYPNLTAAEAAAQNDDEITLLTDIYLTEPVYFGSDSGLNLTLNLNGHNIYMLDPNDPNASTVTDSSGVTEPAYIGGTIAVQGGKLTIKDSADTKGTIQSTNQARAAFVVIQSNTASQLIIQEGNFRTATNPNGLVTLKDAYGTVQDPSTVDQASNPAVTISKGNFDQQQPAGFIAAGYQMQDLGNGTYGITEAPVIASYTITWLDADQVTVLYQQTVTEGETPVYQGAEPYKAEDESNIYTFAGWNAEMSPAYGDATYIAVYNATPKIVQYTVTWYDEDQVTVLYQQTLNEGETPVYAGPEPYKAEDESNTYAFAGWNAELAPVYSDAAYVAVYNATPKIVQYTVTWYDEDQVTVLYQQTLNEGETPVYQGAEPAKAEDETYTYSFAGWNAELAPVYSDAAYVAVYNATPKIVQYTVTWYDDTWQNVLYQQTLNEGETPVYQGAEPAKAEDETYTYSFAGWDPEIGPAYDNTNYVAVFTPQEKTVYYPVIFYSDHGTVPDAQSVQSGTQALMPEDLYEDGWTFNGWFTDAECTAPFDFATAVTGPVDLYAGWTEIQYFEVSYNPGEHDIPSLPNTEIVEAGKTAVDPGPVEVVGEVFEGWKEEGVEELFSFDTPITQNIVLYAVASAEPAATYTVSFNLQGHGTQIDPQEIEEGQPATRPEDPLAEGYSFGGWFTDSACTNPYQFTEPVTAAVELFALWTENPTEPPAPVSYTVSFNMNGHGEQIGSQEIEEGQTATRPEDSLAEGYSFGGWFTDSACTNPYQFTEPVTAAVELFALWTENPTEPPAPVSYTVSFNLMGHGTQIDPQNVEEGKQASRPTDPTAEGFTFGGWFTDASLATVYDFNSEVHSNLELCAKWTENPAPVTTYKVSFNMNGHGTQVAEQIVNSGSTAQAPTLPTAEGFDFCGWYTDSTFTNEYKFTEPVTADTVLYARWDAINYCSISFYSAPGGNVQVIPGQIVKSGGKATPPTVTVPTGYEFKGWFSNVELTNAYDFNAQVTKNITLYAKWVEVPTPVVTYTVTFKTDKGTAPAAQTVNSGSVAVKPTDPTAEGYIFGGWYTESSYTNLYNFNTPVTKNVELYAKWAEIPVSTYTVSFNANGHGDTPNPQTVKTGQLVTKPADPQATGYLFTGWFTSADCTTAFNFSAPVNANTVLYAGWSPVRYTVRFDANGGAGVMNSISCVYGTSSFLPKNNNTLSRTGYYFIGWNTASDGTGQTIADGAEILNLTSTNGATVDLFAQWKNIYNVIEGMNSKVYKGGTTPLTFKTDGDYNKFTGIKIDNNTVAGTQYRSWSGSTYVQLNSEYVNKMPAGNHTIQFLYTDGSCQTTFEVVTTTPTTGDTNNTFLFIIIAIIALLVIAIAILILLAKRRRDNRG